MTTIADYNVITTTRSGGPITERADTIYGTDYVAGGPTPPHNGADLIFGAGGGDTISAKFGDDVINAGLATTGCRVAGAMTRSTSRNTREMTPSRTLGTPMTLMATTWI